MVIGTKQSSGNLQQLTILLRNGKRYTASSDAVLFRLSSFDQLSEVSSICPAIDFNQVDSDGLLELVPVEYNRAIQQYQGSLRLNKALAHEKLSTLYDHFSPVETVSLDELALFVYGSQPTPIQRHVTFLHVLSDNVHFMPASTTMGSEDWRLRSKSESASIANIIDSIRNKDQDYTQFLSHVKGLLEFYHAHADPVLGTFSQSALDMVPHYANQLTESDKKFLQFIADWIRSPKTLTTSPYEVFAPTLLKALKVYDDLFFGKPLAIRFLKEVGMFKPWDNVFLLQDGDVAEEFFWTDRAQETDAKMKQYAQALMLENKTEDACKSIRHDFGDLPVYTIDDSTAKEIDDGISIEKIPGEDATWLHVHIADPTTHISPEHEISGLLQQKVQTLYLPERHFPMLPESLSSKKFSLGSTAQKTADGSQYAMSFSAKVDNDGQLLDYKVRPSLIRNVNKVYYDDLDTLLLKHTTVIQEPLFDPFKSFSHPSELDFSTQKREQTLLPAYKKDLLAAFELSKKHLNLRTRNGALFFGRPSPTVSLLEPLDLPALSYTLPHYVSSLPPLRIGLDRSQSSPARMMVAETMIMGGRIASLFSRDQGVDILFRGQTWNPNVSSADLAKREELYSLRDPETGWVKYQDMLRYMQVLPAATMSTQPAEHVTMGIQDGYTRATSPLRRFTDVVVHWQLKAHLLKQRGIDRQELERMIPVLETRGKRLNALQNQATQFWVVSLLYRMSADCHLSDMEWNCIVNLPSKIAQTELGGIMEVATGTLLDFGIRARIEKLKRNVEIGEVVKVRISNIQHLQGKITLEMIE